MELLILLALISIVFLASLRTRRKPVNKKSIKKTLPPVSREQVSADANNKSECHAKQQSFVTVSNLKRVSVEYVIDGDTVVVSDFLSKYKIRLDAIDCPENGQHWGDVATYGLIKLIGGCNVYIEDHGTDAYDRTLATIYICHKNGPDLMNVNERMVTLGHAWVMRRYYGHLPQDRRNQLNRLERWARSKKVGLWSTTNPVPPWKWRNN
jgi:endonuclease YncB( thermonuclease family)